MNDKSFNINFELFYDSEDDIKKEIEYLKQNAKLFYRQRDVFDLTNDVHINYISDTVYGYSYKYLNSEDKTQYQCSADDFKRAYRKFYKTRIHSKVFDLMKLNHLKDPETKESCVEYTIDCKVNIIRGPKTVVLAMIEVVGIDTPTNDVIREIKTYLQENLPLSKNGKITSITPVKISSVQSSYIIPFKKLMPRITPIRVCKRLDDFILENNKQIFEYKWIQLKTGVIIVQERFGELINPITGNKIDPMFIEGSWSAFDSDLLLHILDKPLDVSLYHGNISEQLANEVLWQLIREDLPIKTFNDRICSYYGRRYQFINYYEKLRASKRALSMMGKDILD